MVARLRLRGLMTALVTAGIVILAGGGTAWAAVTPPSGPVEGGTTVTVDVPQNRFTQLSSGYSHALGLAADGTVWAWGDNQYGQLGDGTTADSAVPVQVQLPAGIVVTEIAAGSMFSLALTDSGAVYGWGRNSGRQLADGTTTDRPVPDLASALSGVQVASLYAGYGTSTGAGSSVFAITADGLLYGWGSNGGKLGIGTTTSVANPTLVSSLPTGVSARDVVNGAGYSVVLGSDGWLYTSGNGSSGSLGQGAVTTVSSFAPGSAGGIPAGVTFTSVVTGRLTTYALGSDGIVYGWGSGFSGLFGDGTADSRSVPAPLSLPADVTVSRLGLWENTGYVLASDGTMYTLGVNDTGQYGNGTTSSALTATAVSLSLPADRTIASLVPMAKSALVLLSDGTVLGWGSNSQGELSDGTILQRLTPVAALSPTTVEAVTFDGTPGTALVARALVATVVTPAHAAGAVDVAIATRTRTDGAGPTYVESAGFTYLAPPVVAPVINSAAPASGQVSEPYTHAVTATGTAPISFSLTGTLPPGLVFDPGTGILSGTPTAAGDYSVTVTATNAAGSDSATYTIRILAAPAGPAQPAGSGVRGTALASSGISDGLPSTALVGGVLMACGAGILTLRSVLPRRA